MIIFVSPSVTHAAALQSPLILGKDLFKNAEFSRDYKTIQELYYKKADLNGLEKFGDEIQPKWESNEDRSYFFALETKLVISLTSGVYGTQNTMRQYELARKYAVLSLNTQDVPLDLAVKLLQAVDAADANLENHTPSKDWNAVRSVHMELWFKTGQRLDAAIQQYPHVSASELAKVVEPANNHPAGSNETVEALRKYNELQYSDMLASGLQQTRKQFIAAEESAIVRAYAKQPKNTDELRHFFDEYGGDKDLEKRVFDQLAPPTK